MREPRDLDARTIAKVRTEQSSVESGGHQDELDIWPLDREVTQDDQQEIRVDRAFVDLVNHYVRDAIEIPVAL
eukprot:COSAG05_NODE_546_length_8763_cov_12.991228_4_plen_73_part_00